MTPLVTASQLDDWVEQYRNRDFILSDPMQLPHRLRDNAIACEYWSLLAALLSYGSRPLIIAMLHNLNDRLGGDLLAYLATFEPRKAQRDLAGFVYRFNQPPEIIWLLERLAYHFHHTGSLEALWLKASHPTLALNEQLGLFLRSFVGEVEPPETYGARYLLTRPERGGACKRWMLFLRWVVRHDDDLSAPVDFGLWRKALSPADLVIPVDTHVSRLARQWGLTHRKANDWQAASQITTALKAFHAEDPLRYDFAFMGVGVETSRGNTRIL